jgi:hypothetical protein
MALTEWSLLLLPWVPFLILILWDTRDKKIEAQPNASERRPFLRRHDGFDVVNLAVLTFTFLAASFAAYEAGRLADLTDQLVKDGQETGKTQAELTRASNTLNRDALVASSRAWVGPTIAKIEPAPEIGKPLKISIQYANTGKEPALNFVYTADVFTASAADEANGVSTAKVEAYFKGCRAATNLRSGQAVFPTVSYSANNLSLTSVDGFVDQAILDGETTVIIDGCFAYKSFDVIRHSYFCFFFNSKKGKPDALNYCDNGAGAD